MLRSRYISFASALLLPFTAFAASPLADAPSPFVRAHADSPVHWMLWGEAAFARAKAENKPVFLAIGAFTNELSRAMRTQSFAREENAALLNENFVCIIVDRDDEPALAALAQHFLATVKQAQGWPLNLWLTPELKPFEGASYLPPSDEWGKEGFTNAAKRVLAAWQADPAAQRAKADEAVAAQLAAAPSVPPAVTTEEIQSLLNDSATAALAVYDATNGGFGDPPKHPQPELLRFLLRHGGEAREAALNTLRKFAASPVRDPLDGGFFRYASDAELKIPYLQKTLSDQARLALAYLEAAEISGDAGFGGVARGALDYAYTLRDAERGFIGAEDGTPENVIPSFLWTESEVKATVGGSGAEKFCDMLGIRASGNVAPDAYLGIDATGRNLLSLASMPAEDDQGLFLSSLDVLRKLRKRRPAPLRDDIAPAGAHSMLLTAGWRYSRGPEVWDRIQMVMPQIHALIRDRFATAQTTSPRDFALMIECLLNFNDGLGVSVADARALAQSLLEKLTTNFGDPAAGRFFAAAEPLAPGLWARVHLPAPDVSDLPSAEAAALFAFATHQFGDAEFRDKLAAAIVQEINDSPNPPRGDQLLALRAFVEKR